MNSNNRIDNHSDKGFVPTALLVMFLGALGIHRFYVGKYITGILMLLTLGGFGIWQLIDYIIILTDGFADSEGRPIRRVDQIQSQSSKDFIPTFFLCAFLGFFGIHRFYTGNFLSAILMFLTLGGLGIWVLIDTLMILTGGYKDGEGLTV
jgi:TM2 domain-containing membrane protein YozV